MSGESALFLPVPETHKAVERHRARLDPSSKVGVPSHITVLYPFVPPASVTPSVLSELSAFFAGVPAFTYALTEVRWFDERVVYLAPTPDGPFKKMTTGLMELFPQCLPYGGAYDEIIPHLCVGESPDLKAMQRAARRVRRTLPIEARAHEVWLMAGRDTEPSWHLVDRFPLG